MTAGDDLTTRLRRYPPTAQHLLMVDAADEIDRLNAEVSRLQMECRQWRQAVDMATRRAVAAEESLKPQPPAPAHPQPWLSPFFYGGSNDR